MDTEKTENKHFFLDIKENNDNYRKQICDTREILDDLKKKRADIEKILKTNISFFYPHQIDNVFPNNFCDFIINESENFAEKNKSEKYPDGWTKTRHRSYPTTDIPICSIPILKTCVFNYIRHNVLPYFEKYYKVNKYFLDFNDVFIVKYDSEKQSKLNKHRDGTIFSFNILLNDTSNFTGGGTKFYFNSNSDENNLTILNKKGSLVIHSGFIQHEGLPITSGVRYILVGFISYLKNEFSHIINSEIQIENSGENSVENKPQLHNKKNRQLDLKKEDNVNLHNYYVDISDNYRDKLIHFMDIFKKSTYLLDKNKDKINLIEKVVYDLFIYHMKKDNKLDDIENYEIEYWIKNDNNIPKKLILHNTHSDKDEKYLREKDVRLHPYLSTITYLHTSETYTVISNMNEDDKEEHNLVLNHGINLSRTIKNKHITFNGSNVHNVVNLNVNENTKKSRYAIMFNIWFKHKPYKVDYFNNVDIDKEFIVMKNNNSFCLKESKEKTVKNIDVYNMYKLVKYFNQNKPIKFIEFLKKCINTDTDNDTILLKI